MAKVSFDSFLEREIERVFIAGNLVEAQKVEQLLTGKGIDYAVEVEPFYRVGIATSWEYQGAAFYVLAGQAEFCRKLLQTHGFSKGVSDSE